MFARMSETFLAGVVPAFTGAKFNSKQDDAERTGGSGDCHDNGRTSLRRTGRTAHAMAWKKATMKAKGDHMRCRRARQFLQGLSIENN
jgi:hypothetical protein